MTSSKASLKYFTITDKTAASQTLLKLLASPYPSEDPSNPHPATLSHVSRLYKLLLQGGHFSHSSKIIEKSPRFPPLAFATQFIEVVGRDHTTAMAKGEGSFVAAALCETVIAAGEEAADARKTLNSWLGGEVEKQISTDQKQRGTKVLLEQIGSLRLS